MTKRFCDICGEEINENAVTTGWGGYSLIQKSWTRTTETYDVCQNCFDIFVSAFAIAKKMRNQKGADDEPDKP